MSELAKLDQEASRIGYDPEAHEAVRQSEQQGRESESKKRTVDDARATLLPLQREIGTLAASIAVKQQSVERFQAEVSVDEQEIQEYKAKLLDKSTLEREVITLKEQVNRKTSDVGGAQGKLKNLNNIRDRQKALSAQRDGILRQISLLKTLEHAFSKDGVPALLIEQALPEIEEQANTLLDRLSNGGMSVTFATQAEYKDDKRTDKKETLDIVISDAAGNTRIRDVFRRRGFPRQFCHPPGALPGSRPARRRAPADPGDR